VKPVTLLALVLILEKAAAEAARVAVAVEVNNG
jgi:hypothetical protein